MLWNEPEFLAIYRRVFNAAEGDNIRKAQQALRDLDARHAAGKGVWGGEAALYALRTANAYLGDYVDSVLAAMDHAIATIGATDTDDDLHQLESMISEELERRKGKAADVVGQMLKLGLSRELAAMVLDQAKRDAEGKIRARIHDGRMAHAYREKQHARTVSAIFVSHSAADSELASRLKQAIRSVVGERIEVFVSSDLESIKGGEDWLERILARLKECAIVVAIMTPNSLNSHWVHYEIGVADARDPLVLPVAARGVRLSKIPAPLGRRQGRDLTSRDSVIALLAEIADRLGSAPPPSEPPELEALLREARRPALAPELSHQALQLCELLSGRSVHAGSFDPLLDFDALVSGLSVTAPELVGVIGELEERGWIVSRKGANTQFGIVTVSPTERFFVQTEAALGESDPEADAREVAKRVAGHAPDATSLDMLAKELGWPPRRMNVASYFLRGRDPAAFHGGAGGGPIEHPLILPRPAILNCARE